MMTYAASPQALAARLVALSDGIDEFCRLDRAGKTARALLAAIDAHAPATLGTVARATVRGAPAVSRSIDALVRAGLVERSPDPDNRRRLALRLTDDGRARLATPSRGDAALAVRLERLAHSELRALDRAFEILERMPH